MPAGFILKTIVIKVIAPGIEETPAKSKEKMVRSTEASAWARLRAGPECTFPLVPEPASIGDMSRSKNDGGRVKSLYDLFGEMLCQVPHLLVEQVSFQSLQS